MRDARRGGRKGWFKSNIAAAFADIIPYCALYNKRIYEVGGICRCPIKKAGAVVQIYRFADDLKLNLVEIHDIMNHTYSACEFVG